MNRYACARCGGVMVDDPIDASDRFCLHCGARSYGANGGDARLLEWNRIDPRTPEQRASDYERLFATERAQRTAANARRRKNETPEQRERRLARKRDYRKRNREKINDYQREYARHRRAAQTDGMGATAD